MSKKQRATYIIVILTIGLIVLILSLRSTPISHSAPSTAVTQRPIMSPTSGSMSSPTETIFSSIGTAVTPIASPSSNESTFHTPVITSSPTLYPTVIPATPSITSTPISAPTNPPVTPSPTYPPVNPSPTHGITEEPEPTTEIIDLGLEALDQILDSLPPSNIAFNTPQKMKLGESIIIQLLLSPSQSNTHLVATIEYESGANTDENVLVTTAEVRTTGQMEARLSGTGFLIEAITPEIQAISYDTPTEWKWEIEPNRFGELNLHLTLSVFVDLNGSISSRSLETYDKTITVDVSFGKQVRNFIIENPGWVWTAILVPFSAWIVSKRNAWKNALLELISKIKKEDTILEEEPDEDIDKPATDDTDKHSSPD